VIPSQKYQACSNNMCVQVCPTHSGVVVLEPLTNNGCQDLNLEA